MLTITCNLTCKHQYFSEKINKFIEKKNTKNNRLFKQTMKNSYEFILVKGWTDSVFLPNVVF